LTTGATLEAGSACLRSSGARVVTAAVAARTPEPDEMLPSGRRENTSLA
jgi:hypothetical protein